MSLRAGIPFYEQHPMDKVFYKIRSAYVSKILAHKARSYNDALMYVGTQPDIEIRFRK